MKRFTTLIFLIGILSVVYGGIAFYKYNTLVNKIEYIQNSSFQGFYYNLIELSQILEKIKQEPKDENNYFILKYKTGYVERSFEAYLESRMIVNDLDLAEQVELQTLFSKLWNNVSGDLRNKSQEEIEQIHKQVIDISNAFSQLDK
jgi:hypothetical protein